MATAARLAVSRAFFCGFSGSGINRAVPIAPSELIAGGAMNGIVEFLNQFFEFFSAGGALVL